MSTQRALDIADRYDRALEGLTQEALDRINAAYDASFRSLVSELRDKYGNLEQAGSISVLVQKGAIATELGEALQFLKPGQAPEYQTLIEELLTLSSDAGVSLAEETTKAIDSGFPLGTFTGIPVEAIRAQATEFRQRLYRYSEQQATSISSAIEQGLAQGWGTRKTEQALRQLGISFKSNAETVARTEVLSSYNSAAISRYQAAGMEYAQWVAAPSERICQWCSARSGNVYRLGEARIPSHPRCRCSWLSVPDISAIDATVFDKLRQEGLADLAAAGVKPNYGPTYWEKQAGLDEAPKPVWQPGDKLPKPKAKAKRKPKPKASPPQSAWVQDFPELDALDGILRIDSYDDPLMQQHASELARIGRPLLTRLKDAGLADVHIGPVGMPFLDSNQALIGKAPRGWPPGVTWDTVPGAYNPKAKSVVAGAGQHGAESLILHETGHAVGGLLNFDNDYRLIELHRKHFDDLPPYLQQDGPGGFAGRQEFLAEAFAAKLMNPRLAAQLYGDDTMAFLDRILTGEDALTEPPKVAKPPREFPPAAELDKLEVVRSLGGSTGAELVRDLETDKLFVRKRGSSPDHLREEFAADEAYRALGVIVPKARLYDTPNGPVKLAEFVQGRPLSDLSQAEKQAAYKLLQKDFAADALLGNWDVIGQSFDNILIDPDGKPWRIDNGGSLRFRAQGEAKKGQQWNEYPTELWTLRAGRNRQTAEVFGDLTHFDMVAQIEALGGKRADLLKALPDDVRDTVARRLDEMERIATISRTLEADAWKEGYISDFTRHSMGLRDAGIVDKLPNEFRLDANNKVYDENDQLFDNLRGSSGIVKDLARYIEDAGGDYDIIEEWAEEQGGDSWSAAPRALKWHMVNNRTVPLDRYFWSGGQDASKQTWEINVKAQGEAVYNETLAAFHAWNYEQLQKIDMPNNDRKAGTFQVVRTESSSTMQRYGLTVGDKGVTMTRGAAESTSMFSRVVAVAGAETTVQAVPHHRVLGMYLQSRGADTNSMFYGDRENELVAMLEGLPFDYIAIKDWKDATPNYSGNGKGSQSGGSQPAAPKSPAPAISQDKQWAEYWIKNADLDKQAKYLTIAELSDYASKLGIDESLVKPFGSLKKKATWIAVLKLEQQVLLNP